MRIIWKDHKNSNPAEHGRLGVLEATVIDEIEIEELSK